MEELLGITGVIIIKIILLVGIVALGFLLYKRLSRK